MKKKWSPQTKIASYAPVRNHTTVLCILVLTDNVAFCQFQFVKFNYRKIIATQLLNNITKINNNTSKTHLTSHNVMRAREKRYVRKRWTNDSEL